MCGALNAKLKNASNTVYVHTMTTIAQFSECENRLDNKSKNNNDYIGDECHRKNSCRHYCVSVLRIYLCESR
jgi:hypothetical protein